MVTEVTKRNCSASVYRVMERSVVTGKVGDSDDRGGREDSSVTEETVVSGEIVVTGEAGEIEETVVAKESVVTKEISETMVKRGETIVNRGNSSDREHCDQVNSSER